MNKNLRNAIKAFMLLVCFSFFQNETQAQTFENGIFFQALARDNYANPAKDRKIYVQSTIIQSTINGTNVLVEEYQTTTDATGVFGISIGKGTRTGGSLSGLNSIDWSAGPYFLNLKISITPVAPLESWNYSKDWIDLGTTSFGTVPYALYAKSVAGFDTKLNVSDTTKMLLPYAKSQALTLVQNSLSTKLNTADSVVKYVTPAQLASNKFDTTTLSNRIDLKANTSEVVANTSAIAANTASIALKANTNSLATVATTGSFNDLTNIPTNYVSTVGNISGTSNANGAIITSGALNLTPADATNGGIVTNGTQAIAGNKTFNGSTNFVNNINVKGLSLGLGAGSQSTMFGNATYAGVNGTAVGFMSQNGNSGINNTSIGSNTLRNTGSGSYNTAIGSESGQVVASYNTFVGASTNGSTGVSNSTALGYGAYLTESNTIQLGANGFNGTTPITKVKTSGKIISGAVTYPNTDGTNGQVLTTNGSGIASWVSASGSNISSVVVHGANADLTNVATIGNLQFRYNSSNATLEVKSTSNYIHCQVYLTKKTYANMLNDAGNATKNYKNDESYSSSSWNPILKLWDGSGYTGIVTMNYYETLEINMHELGGSGLPIMPNQSYRVYTNFDGYGNVLIRVDLAK